MIIAEQGGGFYIDSQKLYAETGRSAKMNLPSFLGKYSYRFEKIACGDIFFEDDFIPKQVK